MHAGLAISRSQSVLSQASDSTEDYVEDSEPEREKRRLRKETHRKKTRAQTRSQPVVPMPSVIELTDSDDSAVQVHQFLQSDHLNSIVVFDVSESYPSADDHEDVQPHPGDVGKPECELSRDTTVGDSLPSIRKIPGLPKARPAVRAKERHTGGPALPRYPTNLSPSKDDPAPLSSPSSTEVSDDDGEDILKLGQFAYAAPPPLRRTASKTPSPAESERDVRPIPARIKKVPTTTAYTFATEFTDAALSQLRKCVSCEQAWTVRKTVAHKLKHIQTCAKKNKLSDATLQTLLRKELDSLPPVASTSKAPVGPSSTTPATGTLLENVLKDVQKKKTGRRPQVLQTVKSISETRDSILDRARVLLEDTHVTVYSMNETTTIQRPLPPPDLDIPPATQAFTKSNVAVRNESLEVHPADVTVVFGSSRLGPAQPSRAQAAIVRAGAEIAAHSDVSPLTQVFSGSSLSVARPPNSVGEMPPSTQVFAPSKFASAGAASRRVVVAHDDPMDEPISIHDTSEDDLHKSSPNRPIIILSSPSSSASRRRQSPASPPSPLNAAHLAAQLARSPSPPPLYSCRSLSPDGDGMLHMDDYDYAADEEDFHVQDDYFNRWNECNDGDVYLHYDPQDDARKAGSSELSGQTRDSPERAPRTLDAILEDLPIPGPSTLPSKDVPPPSTEPPKKKTRRKKTVASEGSEAEAVASKDISQDELNAKLKDAILKDETLHLRVLRYEPVHFDVFMKLATDMGITVKKTALKAKVRAFLDQKAIHFYAADPTKSRTRRTRHP